MTTPVDGPPDIQTFYLAESGPNLVFHADQAERVYIQSRTLLLPGDGTIVSATSMGAGTIYTVLSDDTAATPDQLRDATVPRVGQGIPTVSSGLGSREATRYLQLPHPYAEVATLARQITAKVTTSAAGGPRTYDTVEALESWMSSHVRYTTDIPPLPVGADAVTSFLFGSRRGYCEQISTATVVMLRTLGIPAREVVGYVPGSYDPITDLYDVEAKDAHAWVQVWFPGYGWQNFDPTVVVPLANPTPGSVIAHTLASWLGALPWAPIGVVAVLAAAIWVLLRRRWRRPPSWAHRVAADLGRGGARRGLPRRAGETLTAYGGRLSEADPPRREELLSATRLVERATYAGIEPSATDIALATGFARHYAVSAGPLGGDPDGSGPGELERLVEGGPGREQRPVAHQLARLAEGQHCPQSVAAAVEGDQLALLGGAAHHGDLVVCTRQTDHLDLGRVLVGPEERDRVVGGGGRSGEQVAGRGRTAFGRVGPVLDPHQCLPRRGATNVPDRRRPPPGPTRAACRRRPPRCRG